MHAFNFQGLNFFISGSGVSNDGDSWIAALAKKASGDKRVHGLLDSGGVGAGERDFIVLFVGDGMTGFC